MPGPCEPDDSTISFAATYSALRQLAEHQKQEITLQCEYQTEQRSRPDQPVLRHMRKQPQQQCRCEQLDQLTREKGKGTGLTGPYAESQAQCEQRIGYEIRSCPRQRRPTCRRPSDNPRYYCCCEPHGTLRRQCQQEPAACLSIQRRAIRVTENQNFINHGVIQHVRIQQFLAQTLLVLHGVLSHQTSPLYFLPLSEPARELAHVTGRKCWKMIGFTAVSNGRCFQRRCFQYRSITACLLPASRHVFLSRKRQTRRV